MYPRTKGDRRRPQTTLERRRRPKRDSKEVSEMKIAKDRKVIPDPIDDRKFQE